MEEVPIHDDPPPHSAEESEGDVSDVLLYSSSLKFWGAFLFYKHNQVTVCSQKVDMKG